MLTHDISNLPISKQDEIYNWCCATLGRENMGKRKTWNYHHWNYKGKYWVELLTDETKVLYSLKWL